MSEFIREETAVETMTLRDYFAGQALPFAIKDDEIIVKLEIEMVDDPISNPEELLRIKKRHAERSARDAYFIADAILKEREK